MSSLTSLSKELFGQATRTKLNGFPTKIIQYCTVAEFYLSTNMYVGVSFPTCCSLPLSGARRISTYGVGQAYPIIHGSILRCSIRFAFRNLSLAQKAFGQKCTRKHAVRPELFLVFAVLILIVMKIAFYLLFSGTGLLYCKLGASRS